MREGIASWFQFVEFRDVGIVVGTCAEVQIRVESGSLHHYDNRGHNRSGKYRERKSRDNFLFEFFLHYLVGFRAGLL